MRYLILALLLAFPLLSDARSRGHGGHQGTPSTTTSTPTPAAATPSGPDLNGRGVGETQSMGPSYAPTPGAYNNACTTWIGDVAQWRALFGSCS